MLIALLTHLRTKTLLWLVLFSLSGCVTSSAQLTQGKQDFMLGDYHQAFKKLEPLAIQGNADAQYAIGYMYFYGQGTPQNSLLAAKWMQAAANQGQTDAIKALTLIKTPADTDTQNPTFSTLPAGYQQDIDNATH